MIASIEKITLQEIVKATGGDVLFGDLNTKVCSISTSSNEIEENTLFIPIKGEKFDGHTFISDAVKNHAIGFLTEKNIKVSGVEFIVLVNDTRKALMDIASMYIDKFVVDTVALTGSVGKTTTKEFVANVLAEKFETIRTQKNYNNEIGMPFTVFSINNETEKAVIEMGMSDFGEIVKYSKCAKPKISVITNIGVSHIEYLKTQDGILKAKSEIFEGMSEDGVAILNGDDPYLLKLKNTLKCRVIYFGIDNENCDVIAKDINENSKEITFNINENPFKITLLGRHNVYNALAAYCVAKEFEIDDLSIQKGFESFKSDGLRQSIIEVNGAKFINDCYNASPQSMMASIDVLCNFDGRKIAILGDMGELGENSPLYHKQVANYINKSDVDMVLTVGELSKNIFNVTNKEKMHFNNNEEVVLYLKENIKNDDIVLIKGSRFMKMEEILKNYTIR